MKKLVFVFVFLLHSSTSFSDRTIDVHEVSEILDVTRLDMELEQMVSKVRQCAAVGLASASDCYCHYPARLDAVRQAYDRLAEKYPNWMDRSIRWWNEGSDFSSNLYLRGIRQRLSRPCS